MNVIRFLNKIEIESRKYRRRYARITPQIGLFSFDPTRHRLSFTLARRFDLMGDGSLKPIHPFERCGVTVRENIPAGTIERLHPFAHQPLPETRTP